MTETSLVARRRHLPGLSALVGRLRRRRHRRPSRHHRPTRPPDVARGRRALALAVLHLTPARRRLRRQRLPRRRPPVRHPRGLRRAPRPGPRAGTPGARRPRAQPHVERPPLVPGGTARPSPGVLSGPATCSATAGARTATSRPTTGRAPSADRAGPGSPSPTAARASGTCTCSTSASPTSTGPTPRSATSSSRCCGSGSTAASTGSASTSRTGSSRPTDSPTPTSRTATGPTRPRWRPCGTSPACTTSTAAGGRSPTSTRDPARMPTASSARGLGQARRGAGPLRARRRAAPVVQLRVPDDAVARRGPARTPSPRRSPPPRPSGAPQTWVLSNHDVVRHATRLGFEQSPGLKPAARHRRRRPAAGRRPRPAAGPRGHHRHARAARVGVPVPGRGAGPPGGDPAPRRRPPGPDLGALEPHPARPRRLPRADAVGGQHAVARLRPGCGDLAAATARVRSARRRPAAWRRGLDPRAVPAAPLAPARAAPGPRRR